jgi:hypothetical protein
MNAKTPITKFLFQTVTLIVVPILPVFGSDYYDVQKNIVNLREVVVDNTAYKNVAVRLGQVQSVEQGSSVAPFSTFSFATGVLRVPFVRAGSVAYKNVSVTIGDVLSVGSELPLSNFLPSGETYIDFKQSVIAAWHESANYMDPIEYKEQLARLNQSLICYGFFSKDIIPITRDDLNWEEGVYIQNLYPMRRSGYDNPIFHDIKFPDPFVRVNVDANSYAQTDQNIAALRGALTDALINLNSRNPSNAVMKQLKESLLSYARANAISEGVLTNWSTEITPNTPVHFEILPLTMSFIHAFNHVNNTYTSSEKRTVGNWLNKLVSRVLASSWGDNKQDNKVYYRSQIALAWGIVTGDSRLVRNSILIFKNAINEMRMDGSFINESSRGGSANLYQSSATDSILSIALALEENFGLPALDFSIDGKNVWTAAGRVVDAHLNQVSIASQYGKNCEGGSFGTVNNPDSRWGALQSISYLRIALKREGLGESPNRIRSLPWKSYYYPEREGIDLLALVGN